jgi:hypothetical protein
LSIIEYRFLASFSTTFPKAPVVDHDEIISVAQEILGEFSPTLYTFRIAFKVKDHTSCIGHFKVDGIDSATVFHIKIQFLKWKRILECKSMSESFGSEECEMLKEIK